MARPSLSDLDLSDLKNLTSAIVQDVAPDESDIFNAVVDSYIEQCQTTQPTKAEDSDEFHFGVPMEVIQYGPHILAGTLALVEIIVSAHRIKEEKLGLSQIQHAWQQYLERAGLSPGLAKVIPIKFGAEMIKLLEKANARSKGGHKKYNV